MKKFKLWIIAIVIYSLVSLALFGIGLVIMILINGAGISVLYNISSLDLLLASQIILISFAISALFRWFEEFVLLKSRIYHWIYWCW